MPNSPPKSRIHFWDRCFFKRDLSLDGEFDLSIRRLSVTIVITGDKPFIIRDDNDQETHFYGIILGPNRKKGGVYATDSAITTIDTFVTTDAYWDLLGTLGGEKIRTLTAAELRETQAICQENFAKNLTQEEVVSVFDSLIYSLCERNSRRRIDPRIERVCALIEEYPANEITISFLAERINLSESRLRALFKQEMLCALSLYIRNVAIWKTLPMLARGSNFTEAAHAAGFHDLAHYSKAVSGFTGGPPSEIHNEDFTISFGFDSA